VSKKVISTFLYVTFLLFITAPTILLIVDDTKDVSIFFSTSEEEEESSEKNLNIEVLLPSTENNYSLLVFSVANKKIDYLHKTYLKPHLNTFSPPPEFQLS